LEEGARQPQTDVDKPGTEESVPFRELCRTGGLLNAYEAARIASTIPANNAAEKGKQNSKPTLKQKKD
jgi:hypothetical protein